MVGGEGKKPKGRRGGKKGQSNAGSSNNDAGGAGAGGPSFPVVSDSRFSSMHSTPVSGGLSSVRRTGMRRPPHVEGC